MTHAALALQAAIAALPPVSLAEVNRGAELLTRVDRKYLVPSHLVGPLIEALGPDVRALEIAGRRTFAYDSVYFDTRDLSTYRAHLQRRRRRYKVRTRSYLDSDTCLLEVKLKGARGSTVKQRIGYPFRDRGTLTPDGYDFVHRTLHSAYGTTPPPLVPAVRTAYQRATLHAHIGATRITCDVGLTCSQGHHAIPGLYDHALIEVKSATSHTPADQALRGFCLRPVTVSKYCLGVAMLYPTVHANPWHRTLRTCFGMVVARPGH